MTDPIADLLTRIRNGAMARKDVITIPYSNVKMAILKVMEEQGFVAGAEKNESGNFKEIKITLNPEKNDISLKRISKPGQRIYVKHGGLKKIHGGLGVAIVSTSHGIMSAEKAKKQNLGGELLCEIY